MTLEYPIIKFEILKPKFDDLYYLLINKDK